MVAYAYMLRCADGSYYVGSTRDLSRRVWEHQEGLGTAYTRERRPVELVWCAEYPNVGEAFAWEKRIQSWSRAKREALIKQDYEALTALAKKEFRIQSAPAAPRAPVSGFDHLARLQAMTRPAEVVAVTDEFLMQIEASRPGLIHGLHLHGSLCWGEFFHDSDIDFVAVFSRAADARDLDALGTAHARVREVFPDRRYEGFYCQPGDLAVPPAQLGSVPVHYAEAFDAAGRVDVNPVTWHELAERGIIVRGGKPTVHTDLEALLDFTRANLASYWRPLLARLEAAGDAAVGNDADAVTWGTLGIARLHHLLARHQLTSKSGAGRYIVEELDPCWHQLADDALAIRERPAAGSTYGDLCKRGRDLREFMAWAIDDGLRLR